MKKLFLLVVVSSFVLCSFAQDAASFLNAGNDALRNKNYKEALNQFEKYFSMSEQDDDATIFNAAYCANKIGKYEKAIQLYNKSIKNRYKESSSYYFKAIAYKKLNKQNDMVKTAEEGLVAKPGNSKLESLLYQHYMKQGIKYQQGGDIAKAETDFTKVSKLSGKKYRVDALLSLGKLFYNSGASILEKARPLATTDKIQYATEKSNANKEFVKALGFLEEAASANPTREDVKTTIADVKKVLN